MCGVWHDCIIIISSSMTQVSQRRKARQPAIALER
jgi:hypothetical protein